MSVMAVASGPEVVASLNVCDSCFNALAPCRSQKADDVLSDFFVFHSVGVFLFFLSYIPEICHNDRILSRGAERVAVGHLPEIFVFPEKPGRILG